MPPTTFIRCGIIEEAMMMSQMHPVLTDVLREIVRAVMEIVMIFLTNTIESLSSYLESS